MKRKATPDWLETSRAKRLVQITNIRDKISGIAAILPFPEDKTERVILICQTHIALINYGNQARARMAGFTKYENSMNTAADGIQNAPAPDFDGFEKLALPTGAFVGLIPELRRLMEDIKRTANYTHGIGQDLMIVARKGEEINKREVLPVINLAPITGTYRVRVTGNLRGMDAIRLDWLKKGADEWLVGVRFLTKLPGEIEILPTVAGEPEAGALRAILIDENEPVGRFTPNYQIVVG